MEIQFPSHFLWGAAISSYQCEGNNFNCDWYLWEKEKFLEAAGRACDHYHLFDKDFQLAQSLDLNYLRFSIEWARVNPAISSFSQEELDHYIAVVDSLLNYKLKPIITLHHFTNPIWFANKGGWLNSKNIDYFLNFLKKTVESLKDRVDTWLIFNEPLVYIYNGFVVGSWPPGKRSLTDAKKVLDNITSAYLIGYQEIKNIYKESSIAPQISLAKNLRKFCGCPSFLSILNSLSASSRSRNFNYWLIERLRRKRSLDFLAINYYCKEYTKFKGLVGVECKHDSHGQRKNHLGWNVYPQGFYEVLKTLKKFGLPIIVTENGTAEIENHLYEQYLIEHLQSLAKAYLEGVDIRGYLWWSLLDNFEWDKGFKYRFGLIEVDYTTMARKVKPFACTYAKICNENKIEI